VLTVQTELNSLREKLTAALGGGCNRPNLAVARLEGRAAASDDVREQLKEMTQRIAEAWQVAAAFSSLGIKDPADASVRRGRGKVFCLARGASQGRVPVPQSPKALKPVINNRCRNYSESSETLFR